MIIKKDSVAMKTMFVAIDSTDHVTPKTGLSTFTGYYSLNGGTATIITTPTVAELDATNMPGVYALSIDEAGMTAAEGELVVTIKSSGMDDVSKAIDIKTNIESDIITALAVVDTNVDSILEDTATTIPGTITTLTSNVATIDTNVDSILEDTGTTIPATIATVDSNVDAILVDTGTTLVAQITALENISAAEVNAEVDAALADIHLDHLLAVDTGASLPGVVGSVFNDLLADDAGTWQFSTNALSNAPLGEGLDAGVIADAVWDEAISGHTTSNTFGGKNQRLIPSETIGDYTGDVSALTAAIATVDSIVDAILVDTDTTIPALIAALENIAASDVLAQASAALSTYDAPTNTEMVAAFTEIKGAGWTDETLKDIRDNVAGSAPSAATIADAVWDEAIADHSTSTTFGGKNQKVVPSETAADYMADLTATDAAIAVVDANVDAILVDTGTTIPGTITTLTTNVATVDTVVDTISTNVDAVLVDTGTTLPATLSTIDGKVDTIDANVDLVLEDTGTTIPGTLTSIDSNVDAILVDTGTTLPATLTTIEGKVDIIDTNVDSVLVDTETTIPGTISTLSSAIATVDSNVDAVLVDTGTTLPATLSGMETKIDTVDTNVDAVLVDTGTTIPGTITTMSAAIAVVDGIVDSILEDTGTTLPASLATILADTNELQIELADGGRTDLLLDNITTIIGALNDLDAAAMTTAVGTAIAAEGLMTEDTVIDGTITVAQLFKTLLAQAAGLTAGGDTSTLIFYGQDDTTAVLTLTLDDENDRTAVVFDFT